MTVIVPAYREDERVMRQTLLSAALQEYANLRVVLLLDDPPNPREHAQREALERARLLPLRITESLAEPRRRFESAFRAFADEGDGVQAADVDTLNLLARHYDDAVRWFRDFRVSLPHVDHSDEFLAVEFFERMEEDLRTTAAAVRAAADEPDAGVSRRRVGQLYARLVRIFQAEVTSFERKQFASLSHEANKAMNLNSYLGLMGGRYCVVQSPGGRVLIPAAAGTRYCCA